MWGCMTSKVAVDIEPEAASGLTDRCGLGQVMPLVGVVGNSEAQAQTLELEIQLIEQRELTLPPARYSWGRDELRRRTR